MVGSSGSPIDVSLAGIPLILCMGSWLKIIRFQIYHFFFHLKILIIRIFFIWSRILVKNRTLSKTRGGNELYSSYSSGKYIFYGALTRGLQSATKQTIFIYWVGPRKDELHRLRKLTKYSSPQSPENSKDTLNDWKAFVDTGVSLHFCCDWGMQRHFRYVWTKLTCTSLPSLIHIVKACFRKVVQL